MESAGAYVALAIGGFALVVAAIEVIRGPMPWSVSVRRWRAFFSLDSRGR